MRMVGQVCPTEIRLSNANHIDTEAVVLDLDQYIINVKFYLKFIMDELVLILKNM